MSPIILRWQYAHWSPLPPAHPHRRLVKSKLVPRETFSGKVDHNINKERLRALPLCRRLAGRNVVATCLILKWEWSMSPSRCRFSIQGVERSLRLSLVKGSGITAGSWEGRESCICSACFYSILQELTVWGYSDWRSTVSHREGGSISWCLGVLDLRELTIHDGRHLHTLLQSRLMDVVDDTHCDDVCWPWWSLSSISLSPPWIW